MPLPNNNPYLITQAICPQCSSILQPETDKTNKGRINEVRFSCINEKTGCGYSTIVSLEYVKGEGPSSIKSEELERRREEARALLEFTEDREKHIRQLIALLPGIKEIVSAMRSMEDKALEGIKSETPAPPVNSEPQTVTG